jgi:polar amino acid transport system substrate-binding protein
VLPSPRSWAALVAMSVLVALFAVGCADDDAAGRAFQPARGPLLTVATAILPAPGLWNAAEGGPTGFEGRLAHVLADRLGLEGVRVVKVPFATIAEGALGGADLALTQMTPTDEREERLDFSIPYLTAPPGVLVRAGVRARDAEDLKGLRFVVVRASTLTSVVTDIIQPDDSPLIVDDRAAALDALDDGRADAVLLDLPVAQGLAQASNGRLAVAGQLPRGESLAAALPEGSPNVEIVNSTLRALIADGTIDDLADRWLGDAGDVPLIRIGGT